MGHFDELAAKKVESGSALVNDLRLGVTSVAAAGTGLSDAGDIPAAATIVNVTGAAVAAGIALPDITTVPVGKTYLIYVNGGTTSCELYPQAADKIAGGADGAAFTVLVNSMNIVFKVDDTQWGLSESGAATA